VIDRLVEINLFHRGLRLLPNVLFSEDRARRRFIPPSGHPHSTALGRPKFPRSANKPRQSQVTEVG
jgi:hypothetical protein